MPADPGAPLTPDRRVRVFISSTLQELAAERKAARDAVTRLRLTPVMFELGARPHPPRELYRAYLAQSDVFVGIYWRRYGWVAPGEPVSGLEDEYLLSGDRPKLIYVKAADDREPRLAALLHRVQADDRAAYKPFERAEELTDLVADDLAVLLTERFAAPAGLSAGPSPGLRAGHLPVPPTGLVGRDTEVAVVTDLLARPGVRLVTVVGPGGIGKTRLALEVAARQSAAGRYDGVWFVDLARSSTRLRCPARSRPRSGSGRRAAGRSLDLLVDRLRDRPVLLVLDNFEQVLAAAPDVAALLTACPTARILVTSRTALRVRAEHELPLAPLPVGTAVDLLVERARDVRPGFDPGPGGAGRPRRAGPPAGRHPAGAGAGRRPAAAAAAGPAAAPARRPAGPPARPRRRHRRPARPAAHPAGHHRVELRPAVPVRAGAAGPAVGVHRRVLAGRGRGGGRDLGGGRARHAVLAGRAEHGRAGRGGRGRRAAVRHARHGPGVRAGAAGGRPRAGGHARPAHHLAARLRGDGGPQLAGPDNRMWARRVDAELDDLRSMMRWAISTDDAETVVRMAAPLFTYWWSRGLLAPMRELADEAAALPSAAGLPPDAAALLLWARGMLRIAVGDVAAARPYLARLRDATGELGDRRLRAHALAGLGLAEAAPGTKADLDQLDEAVATFREIGDDWGLAFALSARGQLALLAGDLATATRLHTDALAAADRIDSGHLRAQVLDLLGADAAAGGDLAGAWARFADAAGVHEELLDQEGSAYCLDGFAALALARGDAELAAELQGAAGHAREVVGVAVWPGMRPLADALAAAVDAALGPAAAAEAGRAAPAGGSPRRWTGPARRPSPRLSDRADGPPGEGLRRARSGHAAGDPAGDPVDHPSRAGAGGAS